MVVSLSSDKAVWDAVLNNEVVQELRKSLGQGLFEIVWNKLTYIFSDTLAQNQNRTRVWLYWFLSSYMW